MSYPAPFLLLARWPCPGFEMIDALGSQVRMGDRVRLWSDTFGRVVCSLDDQQFSDKYPKSEWSYIGAGVLVETDAGDLIHYDKADEDFELAQDQRHAAL